MISPFANNSESMQVGELVIENQQDKVIIYGDIDIYRTEKGLEQAQQLHELFGKIVQALTTDSKDDTLPQSPAATTINDDKNQSNDDEGNELIDNPFL